MKIVLLLAGLCFIAACSSSNKKSSESSQSKVNDSSELIIEDSTGNKNTKKDKKPIVLDQAQGKKSAEASANSEGSRSSYAQLNLLIKNQDEDGILKEGSRILMQNANDVKALNAMAMVYYKRGQQGLAKNLLAKAQKISPSYEVYSNLGIILLANNEKSEALKNFKKAIELNPNDTVSASNAGSIYIKANDYEKATVALEIAYRRGIKDYRILNNYAVALVGVGKFDKAEVVYKEALKENANSKDVLFNYAILLIEHLKRHQEGLDILQRLKFIGIPDDSRSKVQELEAMARKEQK